MVVTDAQWHNFISPEFGKVPEGSIHIIGDTQISVKNSVGSVKGRFRAKTSSIHLAVSTECWLVMDTNTGP